MSASTRPLRRFLQFRITSLLGLMTGIAIGFAPLKLWEVWRKPSPGIIVRTQFVEVQRDALDQLRADQRAAKVDGGDASPTLLESLAILDKGGKSKTVSSPTLMTLDGQNCTMQIGQLSQSTNAAGPLQFDGVYYQVTPKLQRNGRIKLDYTISLKSPGSGSDVLGSAQIEVGQNEPVVVAANIPPAVSGLSDRELLVVLSAESPDASSSLLGSPAPPATLPSARAATSSRK